MIIHLYFDNNKKRWIVNSHRFLCYGLVATFSVSYCVQFNFNDKFINYRNQNAILNGAQYNFSARSKSKYN